VDLQLALILAYSALMLWISFVHSRNVRASGDFFVAGRKLGPGLLFATLLASNIGAGSTVGASGLAYRDGLAAWWWVGSAGLGSLALALWIGPRLRELAAAHDLRTVGDYLELRYDARVRGTAAVLLWLGSLAILAGQLIALAWMLAVVVGTPKWLGCLIGGSLVTTYFALGGLAATVRVNVLQLAVKLVGFAVAIPLAVAGAGGLAALAALPAPSSYWSFWQGGPSGLVYLALLAPAFVVSPGLLQKVFAARDARSVRLGVGWNALGLLLFAGLPVLAGLVARARFPELASAELALPSVFMHAVPAAVGALGLAAVFSAELSAADAVLFMLTTSLAQDLYKRFLRPRAPDADLLRVSRFAALAAGGLGTGIAIAAPSVIATLSVFYTLLGVSLFVPIVGGLLVPAARAAAALVAMAFGILGVLAAQLAPEATSPLPAPLAGLSAAAIGFVAAHAVLVSRPPRGAPGSSGAERG
jgi:SSS family solute:Na+ symporter